MIVCVSLVVILYSLLGLTRCHGATNAISNANVKLSIDIWLIDDINVNVDSIPVFTKGDILPAFTLSGVAETDKTGTAASSTESAAVTVAGGSAEGLTLGNPTEFDVITGASLQCARPLGVATLTGATVRLSWWFDAALGPLQYQLSAWSTGSSVLTNAYRRGDTSSSGGITLNFTCPPSELLSTYPIDVHMMFSNAKHPNIFYEPFIFRFYKECARTLCPLTCEVGDHGLCSKEHTCVCNDKYFPYQGSCEVEIWFGPEEVCSGETTTMHLHYPQKYSHDWDWWQLIKGNNPSNPNNSDNPNNPNLFRRFQWHSNRR